ncbi:MAG: PilN domain-containing protein [Minisyncoccia bacterium]
MSNVLAPEAKKGLDRSMRARYIFITAVLLFLGALLAILALLPAFFSVQVAQASLNAPSIEEANGARDDSAKALRAQTLLAALQPLVVATTTPSDALRNALELQPDGLSITTITFQSGSDKGIVLSGVAVRREAVNAYRDALEESGKFSSVAVPVAALVGTQEGRFTITLTGTF